MTNLIARYEASFDELRAALTVHSGRHGIPLCLDSCFQPSRQQSDPLDWEGTDRDVDCEHCLSIIQR